MNSHERKLLKLFAQLGTKKISHIKKYRLNINAGLREMSGLQPSSFDEKTGPFEFVRVIIQKAVIF